MAFHIYVGKISIFLILKHKITKCCGTFRRRVNNQVFTEVQGREKRKLFLNWCDLQWRFSNIRTPWVYKTIIKAGVNGPSGLLTWDRNWTECRWWTRQWRRWRADAGIAWGRRSAGTRARCRIRLQPASRRDGRRRGGGRDGRVGDDSAATPRQPSPTCTCTQHCHRLIVVVVIIDVKGKGSHTRLPSVGFRSWSRFLAVSLQVMWVTNPAIGCHYFPPGPQLPPQPLRTLIPVLLLDEQRHNGYEQFA